MRIPLFGKSKAQGDRSGLSHEGGHGEAAGGSWEYEGVTYYFCGPGCNRAFQKEAESYLSGEKRIDM